MDSTLAGRLPFGLLPGGWSVQRHSHIKEVLVRSARSKVRCDLWKTGLTSNELHILRIWYPAHVPTSLFVFFLQVSIVLENVVFWDST